MTFKLQMIIAALILFGLAGILYYIRKKRLELKYALSWIFVGILVLIFDFIPSFVTWIAKVMGIASPVNMIFFLGFCFSLFIMFTITVALSITASSTKRLNQKIGLLEKRIIILEKKLGEEEENGK
ncbi:MAG: DUF2304 domain-containing protein [Lachnospiraceae bacterium]|nr:DUF2304 domain-containing protein [Lachnospiraceae bacterium]